MDFSALLVLIQLDDFLMNTASQQYTQAYFGDKFLVDEFDKPELEVLINEVNFH